MKESNYNPQLLLCSSAKHENKSMFLNRVAARISLRMEQLSNLPTNMPEDLRIQAQIELRMLRVLNFQRQLRSEVFIDNLTVLLLFSAIY